MSEKFKIGDTVYDVFSQKRGTIVGYREIGNRKEWQVFFSQNDRPFLNESFLELEQDCSIAELFQKAQFLGVDELKRILSFMKIKGDLTNIYYSMHNSAADFMAHQFKPVMKFIESTTGRLLIADEVGLGKTIEAMYIWEELIARENSQPLLVVCPAVLCEKWKADMSRYFSIDAQIVKCEDLLENLKAAERDPYKKHFALIASLDGIRYKQRQNKATSVKKTQTEKLDDYLKNLNVNNPLLDLVIIDEAHYLRNSETAGFNTAGRLRNIARNLVLLSATPIQTSEENLFNLLRILDVEFFDNMETFKRLLAESKPYVTLSNLLRKKIPAEVYLAVSAIIKSGTMYRENPKFIDDFEKNINRILADDKLRNQYVERFSQKVFYSNYITRTRKRDAFEKRPQRDPFIWNYSLNDEEMSLYKRVTEILQDASVGQSAFCKFQIIGRQRQMASCMPAAIETWHAKVQETQDWFDYDYDDDADEESVHLDLTQILSNIDADPRLLEKMDSKYNALLKELKVFFAKNPDKKVVLFSFYRSTIKYLSRRFDEDGVKACVLMGGGTVNKYEVMQQFQDDPSIRIMLSTEVGSEGVDLQFCDTEINYDLPWNPMRLEQRIGRIDRIGQKSEKLSIINLSCENTIEDRVLYKLYDRIDIFKHSIGDLEEILGNPVREIGDILLNKELSDSARESQAEAKINVVYQKQMDQEKIESEADNFLAYRDFILNNIETADKSERYIRAADLQFYVRDYLVNTWPGCVAEENSNVPDSLDVSLSVQAAYSFSNFLRRYGLISRLSIAGERTTCLFSASQKDRVDTRAFEVVTCHHPLIRWITEERSNASISNYGCSAVLYEDKEQKYAKGTYVYFLRQWIGEGYKGKREIKYYMCNMDTGKMVPEILAEEIVSKTFGYGCSNRTWENDVQDRFDYACKILEALTEYSNNEYVEFEKDFVSENETVCLQRMTALKLTTDRKIASWEKAIFDAELSMDAKKISAIPMHKSNIENEKKLFDYRSLVIKEKMKSRTELKDLCVGLLKVV